MGNKNSRGDRSTLSKYIDNSRGKRPLLPLHTVSIADKNVRKIRTQPLRIRNVENFVVIWLDSTISELNGDIQYSINQLRNVVNSVKTFIDSQKCINFMNEIQDEKIFLIVSGTLGRPLLPLIENMTQIHSIYIFCRHKSQHKSWANQYPKIKGIFIKIERICDILEQIVRQCETDLKRISIMSNTSTIDMTELDQSFMYSQLFKEVLELEYSDKKKKEFVDFCRLQYANNDHELAIIDEFEEKYDQSSSIWWYTRECFIYSMLNKALRTQDMEVIMRMAYFIRDLHRQIEEVHSQSDNLYQFIVYRGQGVSEDEFKILKKSKGCLLSFNTFLSTSIRKDVSLKYARQAKENPDTIAILFCIEIDPSISSTPFASLDNISYYSNDEKEILFSMDAVFRIGDMDQLEDGLWRVDLILTKEIEDETELHRTGTLMLEMGQLEKAEEIYSLSEKTSNDDPEELSIPHYQY